MTNDNFRSTYYILGVRNEEARMMILEGGELMSLFGANLAISLSLGQVVEVEGWRYCDMHMAAIRRLRD